MPYILQPMAVCTCELIQIQYILQNLCKRMFLQSKRISSLCLRLILPMSNNIRWSCNEGANYYCDGKVTGLPSADITENVQMLSAIATQQQDLR